MSNVSVRTFAVLPSALQSTIERIQQRAFDLFRQRGEGRGSDLDDWLRAERELFWPPPCEVIEKDREFQVQMAVPGFDVRDIQITAVRNAIVVQAEEVRRHNQGDGQVRFSDFSDKRLFRWIALPAPIDVDKVEATLDRGILQILAAKAKEKRMTLAA